MLLLQLCTELSSKLSESTSQPLQETAIKKKSVLKKVSKSDTGDKNTLCVCVCIMCVCV